MRGAGVLCYLGITALFCSSFSLSARGQQSLVDSPRLLLLGPEAAAANHHSESPEESPGKPRPFSTSISARGVAPNPDFSRVVLPVTTFKFVGIGLEGAFGTGFCLDSGCRFIATNYHVAMATHPEKIDGERILERFVGTGPDDEGATLNDGPYPTPLKYNVSRDLAIFELRHPLSRYRGATFRLDDLQIGEQVDIYAFPKDSPSPVRQLQQFHGSFEGVTPRGLLGFHYDLSAGRAIRPGASGGIVVDSATQQIVGVLSEIAIDGQPVALAIPVGVLADFVSRVEPALALQLFPSRSRITSLSRDLYPKYELPIADKGQRRPDESSEITSLRNSAQFLADSMRNFIAVQTFSWGSGDNPPTAESAYEVRVLDGYQRFREYPDGTRELQDVPFPRLSTALVPGGEWSQLPEMVGSDLRLRIHQAPDAVINGKAIRVFQYRAASEDNVCKWKSSADFGLFAFNKIVSVPCYGEVWTDEDGNILRISERFELSGKWKDYQTVVTYGWLRRSEGSPRLAPLAIATEAEYNKKLYWCRGQFTNYMVFSSQAKITSN